MKLDEHRVLSIKLNKTSNIKLSNIFKSAIDGSNAFATIMPDGNITLPPNPIVESFISEVEIAKY